MSSTYITLNDALSLHCVTAQLVLDRTALAQLVAGWRAYHTQHVLGFTDMDSSCRCPATLSIVPLPMPRHLADEFLRTTLPVLLAASQQRLGDRAARYRQRLQDEPCLDVVLPQGLPLPSSLPSPAPPTGVCMVQQRLEALALV